MATEDAAVNDQEERLSEELQAELDDEMFFGEEDAPEENLAGSDDFLSGDDLLDSTTDLPESDISAGGEDLDHLQEDQSADLGELEESGSEENEKPVDEPELELSDLASAESGVGELEELPPLDESEFTEQDTGPDAEISDAGTLPVTENAAEETAAGEAETDEESMRDMEELPPLEEGELGDTDDAISEAETESISETSTEDEAAGTEEPPEPPDEPEQAPVDESAVEPDAAAAAEEPETALALDEGDAEEPEGKSDAETTAPDRGKAQEKEPTEKGMDNETLPSATASLAGGTEMLLNFHHEVRVEVARTRLSGEEITQITNGSIIEFDKTAGEPVDLVLDGKPIAQGEVVLINNEKLGIRIIGIVQE